MCNFFKQRKQISEEIKYLFLTNKSPTSLNVDEKDIMFLYVISVISNTNKISDSLLTLILVIVL